ncbi:hypothetical protein OG512_38995 [Streptomyces sp. NBC_01378]|uniref:hypothetical protein n=1 Tax=Streptomyces sp. NBC_01378 TaxID=2903844 RepID=UPI003255E30D
MASRLLQPLFRLSIIVFLTGGAAIVLGQAAGIVLGNAQWLDQVSATLQPATCIAASIAGILSFALSYRTTEGPAAQSPALHENTRAVSSAK